MSSVQNVIGDCACKPGWKKRQCKRCWYLDRALERLGVKLVVFGFMINGTLKK